MMMRTPRPRAGFTLIEMLVVMLIIALLVGLLLPAVMRAGDAGKRTQASTEMNQLAMGISQFREKYPVKHIPSLLVLRNNGNYDMTNALDVESLTWLKDCWPNLKFPVVWNPSATTDPVTLRGDQVLVFALGGVNVGGQPSGFSTNPSNPTLATGSQRVGPFMQFQADRLRDFHGNGYASYVDAWKGQPYVYFSNYGKLNGYRSADATLGVSPYPSALGPPVKYLNENGFQIICAGKDKLFGPGGALLPATGQGEDDQANFSQTPLGNK